MTDVFISYAHEDQTFVRGLVQALEREGLSVWWDHTIPPGKTWDEVIARGIEQAKACIIVWSPHSIGSDWVKEEATLAKDGGKYLPVQIGADQPPVGFRRIQAATLTNWRGDTNDPQWRMLAQEAKNLAAGANPAPGKQARPAPAPTPTKDNRLMLVALGAAALVAAGYFLARQQPSTQAPAPSAIVAETAPEVQPPAESPPQAVNTFAGSWKVSGSLPNGKTFTDVVVFFNGDGTFNDGGTPGRWTQNGANVVVTYDGGAIVRITLDGNSGTGIVQRNDGTGEWRLTR